LTGDGAFERRQHFSLNLLGAPPPMSPRVSPVIDPKRLQKDHKWISHQEPHARVLMWIETEDGAVIALG
jgi:hypothetical protein